MPVPAAPPGPVSVDRSLVPRLCELGDRRFEGTVLTNLGLHHGWLGRPQEQRAHFEQALAIHREVGNRWSEGHVLHNLGVLHLLKGRPEEA